ncbi:hypothetical protein Psch_00341 [Pelotomaculum schinkii]|uniref:HEAT repeat protein n=1 Tax=Pelotomaculum schinkii TaxID=78350 RepID=A0A4Y7RDF6_9FIRM|nr:HEAT repeat domain-containing protein [Pelotomaculum schinkii]TEB06809.1 hypothetical protein Psch_00341 [Pelotomaculum schinkii]
MDKKDAIDFLKKHQPMPDDKNLSKDVITKYNEIREYFLTNPDEDCIPLFLNSFGERDGFGVYQLIEGLIAKFKKNHVMPHLLKALESHYRSIRYWNASIASSFPSEELFEPLKKMLFENDVDIRYASITAIAQLALSGIKCNEVIDVLEDALSRETGDDISEFIQEVIDDIKSSN